MKASEQAFKGRLATGLSDYHPRLAQIEMANAIEDAICEQRHLVVEAGTGTGKTFAYLVPSLLIGKKTIVATGTKTLQDQLFHQDIPRLVCALGLDVNVQILKGRANYLCRYRIYLHQEQGQFQSEEVAHQFQKITEALPRMKQGDISEFGDIGDDSSVWPFVTSSTDNCLGSDCAYFEDCFLVRARRKAMKADVLIINHHLYFSDSLLKEDGFGELLPGAEVIVFDEAHQLPELAAHFYGMRLSSRQILNLMRDYTHEAAALGDEAGLIEIAGTIETMLTKLRRQLDAFESRKPWFEICRNKRAMQAFEHLQSGLKEMHRLSEASCERTKGLARCHERMSVVIQQLHQFMHNEDECIQWVELFKSSFILHVTPASVAESFSFHMQQHQASYVFTSATLAVDKTFSHFTQPLGLSNFDALLVDSPFDYPNHALLYLPRGVPDSKTKDYYQKLLGNVLPVIEVLEGRSFLLFTSYQALHHCAELLGAYPQFTCLIQGTESNRVLLQRFKQSQRVILLGTASFWEGVDVKGQDLSCVVIDKLPFSNPADPVTKAKIQLMKQQGRHAFDEFQLPQAIVNLKQGVGRLIRDEQDKGILIIGDPRFYGRAYGQRFLNSLPPMGLTRNHQRVLEFAKNLMKSDEITCS